MTRTSRKGQFAVAVAAAVGAGSLAIAPGVALAAKTPGKYVSGDFHNHTTCNDGSTSIQKLVRKATDRSGKPWNGTSPDTPFGLDWFVLAGHGNGGGTKNCTLTEDASLDTPLYPFVTGTTSSTTWDASIGKANVKGDAGATSGYMWRWQSVNEYEYPLMEYLDALKGLPLFVGIELNAWGHEHVSTAVLDGQMPNALDTATLSTTAPATLADRTAITDPATGAITYKPYAPLGNASKMAMFTYCFDRTLTDLSRGNITGSTTVGNMYNCANPDSAESGPASSLGWNATGFKLKPASGTDSGIKGHGVTLESIKWIAKQSAGLGYFVPAHLERAGPFNPNGNNGYNIEHLRNFNNAAPAVAFGFETQPGHGASSERGEYYPQRNSISGQTSPGGSKVDSVGGTTWGGTGIYGAWVGGVWDALLGEGRRFWFFASSDWHNRGVFGADDVRSTQDFYPGEYQRNHTLVRTGTDKIRSATLVQGLRSGNNWAASGQLVDRMAVVACTGYREAAVRQLAMTAAVNNTDVDTTGCATMGEKLKVASGADVVVAIVVRDPTGKNFAPYSFNNPSLAQISVSQPLNQPVLDHLDLIKGSVTGFKSPTDTANYVGQWPNSWLSDYRAATEPSPTKTLAEVKATIPAAARNDSAQVVKTFSGSGPNAWTPVKFSGDGTTFYAMTFKIPAVTGSQYVRVRGTNLPANVPSETDASGNPLPDVYTNATTTVTDGNGTPAVGTLKIPCNATGSNVPENNVTYTQAQAATAPIDGCPKHLATVNGQKFVSYDVAAWSDLWTYSNPVYIEVAGGVRVAGVP